MTLAVDGTGVGSAVYDILRRNPPAAELLAIVITSGRKAEQDRRDPRVWRVPKSQLVEAVTVAVTSGRLEIAAALREMFEALVTAPTLLPEKFRQIAEMDGVPRAVGDYLAGMTDRYAFERHRQLA